MRNRRVMEVGRERATPPISLSPSHVVTSRLLLLTMPPCIRGRCAVPARGRRRSTSLVWSGRNGGILRTESRDILAALGNQNRRRNGVAMLKANAGGRLPDQDSNNVDCEYTQQEQLGMQLNSSSSRTRKTVKIASLQINA